MTIDTASLVRANENKVLLCPYNSGSTIMNPVKRGKSTFLTVSDYDYETWRKARGRQDAVVELVITGGVPDIRDHVLAVHRVHEEKAKLIWRMSTSSEDEGPYPPA